MDAENRKKILNYWSERRQRKNTFFKAKIRIAKEQHKIQERRAKLLPKLLAVATHPRDKKVIEIAFRSKNLTPRYW